MGICFTALYLNDTAQYELCTVQHARFVLATIVCTVAHSATAPYTFYHGSSRYCHGEKLVPEPNTSGLQAKWLTPAEWRRIYLYEEPQNYSQFLKNRLIEIPPKELEGLLAKHD